MRLNRVLCFLALAAAPAFALACENEENQAPPKVAQPQQPQAPSVEQRARSLLLAADLQLRDLRESRDQITDPDRREAIANQIVALSMGRDRLMGDLAAGGPDTGVLERDLSNLQRVMHAKGAAETQPTRPAPRRPTPQPPGPPPPAPPPPESQQLPQQQLPPRAQPQQQQEQQPPIEQPPVEQPPVEQPPVEQPPVEQPPVQQPPIQQPRD
jgi:hypothetical protein